ncbi:MAG: response regulator [Candidatus Omnitrophica bacterium]|nr:response regulator [Candidatus Omnitrophota bacterium]
MAKRILIIDDEPDLLKVTAKRLEASGYEVVTALDYEEAYHLMIERVPDLILLDVVMPGKDGYEACNELKSAADTRNVPIILFTAQPDQRERLKKNAKFIAADDYIMKPFDDDVLLEKIKRFIG